VCKFSRLCFQDRLLIPPRCKSRELIIVYTQLHYLCEFLFLSNFLHFHSVHHGFTHLVHHGFTHSVHQYATNLVNHDLTDLIN
jgi:hypothetical protein